MTQGEQEHQQPEAQQWHVEEYGGQPWAVRGSNPDTAEFMGMTAVVLTLNDLEAAARAGRRAVELLREIVTPCEPDSGGRPYCIAHSEQFPCPHAVAREFLALIDSEAGASASKSEIEDLQDKAKELGITVREQRRELEGLRAAAQRYAYDACYDCGQGHCTKPFHAALLEALSAGASKEAE